MTIQELIEKINKIAIETPFPNSKIVDHFEVIKLIEQLDEPEKITIPQYIANWIEECKAKGKSLLTALLYTPEKVNSWVDDPDNQEIFALAWLFGYTVKKEKRYFVKIKATKHCFARDGNGKIFFSLAYKGCFTQTELEKAGFGWVFDCPGIEIEEAGK